MSEMFIGCSNLTNLDLSNFNTNTSGMFYECNNIPLKIDNIFIDKSYDLDESVYDNDNDNNN